MSKKILKMEPIYTIVLTPPSDFAKKYIEASQLFDEAPSYLLKTDGSSSPHVTVVQFHSESEALAYKVWAAMYDKMRQENFEPFSPVFTGISFIEGVEAYEGTAWVELSIQRGEETSPILKVHNAALKVLESFDLKPLNANGSNYRPHLTLARIVMRDWIKLCPKTVYENPGKFRLEFGLSDEKWQYVKMLAVFP